MKYNREEGNVLFLILIAVALFAALSYAVTQSSRGGGNADEESRSVDMARHTQIVADLRVAIQRMRLSGKDVILCDVGDSFCDPADGFSGDYCSVGTDCLFAPEGGGFDKTRLEGEYATRVYEFADGGFIAGHPTPQLVFEIDQIKKDTLLRSISLADCQTINKGYGIATIEKELGGAGTGNGTDVSGLWDFCYDASTLAAFNFYLSVHLLAVQ